jgi:integrase
MLLNEYILKSLKEVGRHTDDQTKGLHLWIKSNQRKYWIFRFTFEGKRNNISLGGYPEIGLKQARERAVEARSLLNKGRNPIKEKNASKAVNLKAKSPIFRDFALEYIETMRPKWRNSKHAEQWVSTIERFAVPYIGQMRLDEIQTEQVLSLLKPIWLNKTVTASRLRGRLESILSASITLGHRSAMNPARWRDHLENLLPTPKTSDKHHTALPYSELPNFIAELKEMDCVSALALEFVILNASRTGEVIGAKRNELFNDLWTVPASRMKGGRSHQVPLGKRSLELLEISSSLDPKSEYFFSKNGKQLSNMAMLMMVRRLSLGFTVHGFRSAFRDWVSEETEYSPELAEMALAHTIGNKVEAAYRRGNLIERRKGLMKHWESFCQGEDLKNIHQIRKVA